MVDCCANPECAKPLRYLREGRLLVFDVNGEKDALGMLTRYLEHYWLCGACALNFTIMRGKDGPRLVPLHLADSLDAKRVRKTAQGFVLNSARAS